MECCSTFSSKYSLITWPISDPYTWTFDHQDQIHFVLYEGTIIVGYAHIQLWNDTKAALRIFVIEEEYGIVVLEVSFLKLIEKWLFFKNIATLQVQSSPAAYQFYAHHHIP